MLLDGCPQVALNSGDGSSLHGRKSRDIKLTLGSLFLDGLGVDCLVGCPMGSLFLHGLRVHCWLGGV